MDSGLQPPCQEDIDAAEADVLIQVHSMARAGHCTASGTIMYCYYCTVLCYAVPCFVVLYCVVAFLMFCCTVLYCTVLCCAVFAILWFLCSQAPCRAPS